MSHFQAVADKEYMKKYYSAVNRSLSMGGLTLVSPIAFGWGMEVVKVIYESYTFSTLERYGNNAASVTWEQVKNDKKLASLFDSIPFKVSNSNIKQLVREELTFKIFNARSCETLRQYKAKTTDRGGKDSCDVSLRKQLQVQSMSKGKKRKQETEIDDDDRCRKK